MKTPEPNVIADDGTEMSYSDARRAWEAGEFSDWAETHGLPITVQGPMENEIIEEMSEIESALSDETWD